MENNNYALLWGVFFWGGGMGVLQPFFLGGVIVTRAWTLAASTRNVG
jgi:hypothetical protein